MTPLPARLLAITDRHQAFAPLPEVVASLLDAGLQWIWLRDRDLPPDERLTLARTLARLTREAGASLVIGADIDLAATVGASGVHLRSGSQIAAARHRLGKAALLGLSAHSLADIRAAHEAGADYATLSPVFASASKPGYGPALGLAAVTEAARIGLPILALGGVTPETIGACLGAGASGVAMMGPLMRQAREKGILSNGWCPNRRS